MKIKALTLILAISVLAGCSSNEKMADNISVSTPKYLAIKDFQRCAGQKDMHGWVMWCMPKTMPIKCPIDTWEQLSKLTGSDALASCSKKYTP